MMAESIKAKYKKHWGGREKINAMLFITTLLDPRFK